MSEIFTTDDMAILDRTMAMRTKLLNALDDQAAPTKARDIEAYLAAVDSADKAVFTKAKITISQANSEQDSANKQLLAQFILNLHNNQPASASDTPPAAEQPAFSPRTETTPSEGELIRRADVVDVATFIADRV